VLPDALTALVALARSRSDAGAVGPRILNPDGSLQYECARNAPTPISEFFVATTLYKRFPRSRVFGRYLMTYWDHDDEREVEAISGACALLRKRALCDSGLFDEDFFMYAEDTDLFCRIREKGWKVYFTPKAEIIHYWGKSAEQVPYPMAIEAKRSMERYFMKHGGLPSVIAHRLLTLVASLSMIAACFIMYMNIFGTKRSNLSFIMKRYLYITGWSIGVK
jgi:GT2 family glycosyltransferase